MLSDKRKAEKILDYWILMELLQPNDFPVEEKSKSNSQVEISYKKYFRDLPADTICDFSTDECWKLKIIDAEMDVCYGRLPIHIFFDLLYRHLNIEDTEVEIPTGDLCLFALRITEEGEYVKGSLQISAFVWAISECIQKKCFDMEALTITKLEKLQESYEEDLEDPEISIEEKIRRMYKKIRSELCGFIPDKLMEGADTGRLIYMRYRDEKVRNTLQENKMVYSDLRKSFILKDLSMIKEKLEDQDKIIRYINALHSPQNVHLNIKEDKDLILNWSEPAKYPLGKWPSKYNPTLMQQLAINIVGIERAETEGIFSVNGPPGTGKTTLLKEVIVSNIVERAIRICKYSRADDAFQECSFAEKYDEYTTKYYQLKDTIAGYEILIASSNNNAVENITKELPKAVDVSKYKAMTAFFDIKETNETMLWNVDGDRQKIAMPEIYFSYLAQEIYGEKENALSDADFWGLISVPLGKQENIRNFYNKVLDKMVYTKSSEYEERHAEFQEAKALFNLQLNVVTQMQQELENYWKWEQTIDQELKRFSERVEKCDRELEKKGKDILDLEKKIVDIESRIKKKQKEKNCIGEEIAHCQRSMIGLREEIIAWEERLNFWEKLFPKIFKSEKHKHIRELQEEKAKIESEQVEITDKIEPLKRELYLFQVEKHGLMETLNYQKEIFQGMLQEKENRIEKRNEFIIYMERTRKKWRDRGIHIIDANVLSKLHTKEVQETSFYTYAAYDIAREKLFYYALRLQRTFILSSKAFHTNLRNISKMWGFMKDKVNERYHFSEEDKTKAFGKLFQTLFLLVPVISTTFASVQTLLRNVQEPGLLGLLVVDEAGQAQPQLAVGALWRCKRALIVGDPKQIEPVVTIPRCVYKIMKDNFYSKYHQKTLSVQSFADILNHYSGEIENEYAGEVVSEWVGCPLTVHRRCIDPMFSISNEIAYGGSMVNATKSPETGKVMNMVLKNSEWIQVEGKEKGNKNHYVEEQGDRVCKMLLSNIQKTEKLPDIFIISPFKSVSDEMRRKLASLSELGGYSDKDKWIRTHCGTVHTFQGKEADEVIFLLGCDDTAKGAVRWVNTNIVNVAVTRAKYRLCVVGDYTVWKQSRLFRVVMRNLFDKLSSYDDRQKPYDFDMLFKVGIDKAERNFYKEIDIIPDLENQMEILKIINQEENVLGTGIYSKKIAAGEKFTYYLGIENLDLDKGVMIEMKGMDVLPDRNLLNKWEKAERTAILRDGKEYRFISKYDKGKIYMSKEGDTIIQLDKKLSIEDVKATKEKKNTEIICSNSLDRASAQTNVK